MAQWSSTESGILRRNKPKEKFDDLLVFGYACKVFRDDEKALYIDQGKHLIPWMGDDKLKIDRYDCRGHLSDLRPYEASREGYDAMRWLGLNDSERKLEQLCDEERYYSLKINEEDEQLYKEEEEKRKKANQFQYSYDVPGDPDNSQEGIPTVSEANDDEEAYVPPIGLDVPVDIAIPKTVKENKRIEKTALFVSKQGMQMEILLKAKQGDNPQFGFLNQGDPLFKFYRHVLSAIKSGRYQIKSSKTDECAGEDSAKDRAGDDHYLHPSLQAASSQAVNEVAATTTATTTVQFPFKPSANCAYSQLVNRIQGVLQPESVPEQPARVQALRPEVPQDFSHLTAEQQQQYYQYYYAAQYYEYYKQLLHYQQTIGHVEGHAPPPEIPLDPNMQLYIQQTVYAQYMQHQHQQQNNSYAQIVSSMNKDASNPYAALLANLKRTMPQHPPQPPEAPPPQQLAVAPSSVEPRLVSSPAAPLVAGVDNDDDQVDSSTLLSLAHYESGSDGEEDTGVKQGDDKEGKEEGFSVPTGEVQVIIDKMASYVSKNGTQFEEIVKARSDPRFDFLHEGHEFHRYYRSRVAELTAAGDTAASAVVEEKTDGEVRTHERDDGEDVEHKKEDEVAAAVPPPPPLAKKEKKVIAPVCFSIKKPKEEPPKEIKSALPMEESDEEEEAADPTAANNATTTGANNAVAVTVAVPVPPSIVAVSVDKGLADGETGAGESAAAEKVKGETADKEPLSSLLSQCMKHNNGLLDADDLILEMIDLTDDLEERRDARRAQDRIKDKIAAAAREKLASVARDRALQLERKRKAAAFLTKIKSGESLQPDGKEQAGSSKSSSRRSSIEEAHPARSKSREVSVEVEKVLRLSQSRDRRRSRDRERGGREERGAAVGGRGKSRSGDKRTRSPKSSDYRLGRASSSRKIEIVQISDSDSESEGAAKKKRKSSKRKKSHKRKHSKSKHDSKSKKKSKKRRQHSDSSSSDSS